MGEWIERIALGWMTWELTGSSSWLGVIAFLRLAPALLAGALGGVLADRLTPLLILRLCNMVLLAGNLLLAVLVATGAPGMHVIAAFAFLHGSLQALGNAPGKAMVWYLVPRRYLPVAIPINSIMFNIAAFVGPAAAGLIIAQAGVVTAFSLAAIGYGAFFVVLLLTSGLGMRSFGLGGPAAIAAELVAGVRYAAAEPALLHVLLLHLVFSLCARPLIDLLPGFASSVFSAGPEVLGIMTSTLGAGAIVAGLWLARRSRTKGLVAVLIGGMTVLVAALLAFVATRSFLVALPALLVVGFCMMLRAVSVQTLLQARVADDMRGRVLGLYTVSLRAGAAVGALAIGTLAEGVGLRAALGLAALVGLAALALLWRRLLGFSDELELS